MPQPPIGNHLPEPITVHRPLIPILLSLGFLPVLGVAAQPWPETPYQQPPAERWNGPPVAKVTPCDETRIIARVGSDVVLACDVMAWWVGQLLDQLEGPIPEDQREPLIRKGLAHLVETKLACLDARHSIPEENLPQFEKQLTEAFDTHQVKRLMKIAKVDSRRELQEKLHRLGSSLDRQKRLFMEETLARQWIQGQIHFNAPITHEQMLVYYRRNRAEFEHPTRARWEQIMVRFSSYDSKEEAHAALVKMGNLVQDGVPFTKVAKTGSDGPTAPDGGVRNWTTKGSLVSKTLDNAVFGLPVGQLSPILEDQRGLHIIRVAEREEAHVTPFTEAQDDIRKKIRRQRLKTQIGKYLTKLKKETPVWTIYDDASPSS